MNQLSDLELVAQAMSGTNDHSTQSPDINGDTKVTSDKTKQEPKQSMSNREGNRNPNSNNSVQANQPQSTKTSSPQLPELENMNLGINQTTSQQLSMLMSLSEDDIENMNEDEIEKIMKQFEVADDVANDLEGKLDKLLETLGGVENDIVKDQNQDQK
ncbi:uncharacterized protein L201_000209 [Kwoniella dendrophila CBS 6074]|uniref:Uncharacterized protein n=1 Tax=Kwoniella dendrophila CBS 6074 TaxID=1295534 RepID=A0AAX4JIQ8_9TREE